MDAPNELVYFKITNIEHSIPADVSLDAFCGSQLGEWGCWVDHSQTRIVQTGIEQSRIPFLQSVKNHGMALYMLFIYVLNKIIQSTRKLHPSRSYVRSLPRL